MFAAISYPPIPIFELGPLTLSLHGLFAGLGFVAGAFLMLREVRQRGFDADKVINVLTVALVASIIGARLFTVPAHMFENGYTFWDAVSPAGDYSILGGYAGGIIAGVIAMRFMRMNIPAHLDMAAPGLALGAVVGRIGDLAIVEHLGSPTTFFLGYELQPGYDVSPQHDVLETLCDVNEICGPYHHTALYDLLGALVLLGLLLWLQRSWRARHYGQLFSVWMIWYGLQRFLIDFTRLGAARDGVALPDGTIVEPIADAVMGPFTGSQWGALGLAALGIFILILAGRRTPVVSAEVDAEYIRGQQGDPVDYAVSDAPGLEPAAAMDPADPPEGDDPGRPTP